MLLVPGGLPEEAQDTHAAGLGYPGSAAGQPNQRPAAPVAWSEKR